MTDPFTFAAQLEGSGRKVERQASTEVIAAALDTQNDAKALAPVLTGTLRRSIHTTNGDDRPFMPGVDLVAEVGPSVDYGAYVEFGTANQRAQPYMQPAADKNAPRFVEALRRMDVL